MVQKVLGFRPANLSADNAKTIDVVLDTIEKYEALEGSIDSILLLEPTSPFRTKEHVNLAFKTFLSGKFNSLVSVTESITETRKYFCKI